MYRALLVCLVALTVSVAAGAETHPDDDRLRIHILTMGQGDELFSRFGHIGILVEDRVTRTKKVYNFGTFDFSDPDLQTKYVRGFLNYWLSVGSYAQVVRRYKAYDREMIVRTLNLGADQKARIAHRLDVNALPENRVYAYRHYLDNCCTRIRDIIDDVTGGLLSKGRNEEPTGRTYRDWTRKALEGMPVMSTLILFSLGPAIDKPITRYDEQFLPVVVAEDLDAIRFGPENHPLVLKKKTAVSRLGPELGLSIPGMDLAVIFILFGLLVVGFGAPIALPKYRISHRLLGLGLLIWGLLAGLGGVALVLYWTVTTHYDTHYNENLLVMPVLHLILLGPAVKLIIKAHIKERTGRVLGLYLFASFGLILLDVVLKVGPFIQDNWGFIAFAAACNATALIALRRTELMPPLRKTSMNTEKPVASRS
ncbi:MAG: DUF4105 domain-containing protein [Deltaproteobacteria bacterium]|nr:DUF4105 domain-containing protein [Deltaproteobacteria bacterium]